MKRLPVFFFTVIFLIIIGSQNVEAGHTEFSINSGLVTDESLSFKPLFWTIGATIDLYLNDLMAISPEFYIITHDFDYVFLAPAVMFNLNFEVLMVGAGLTKWFLAGESEDYSTDIGLKLNGGLNSESIRLLAFVVTPFENFFSEGTAVGFTIGFGF